MVHYANNIATTCTGDAFVVLDIRMMLRYIRSALLPVRKGRRSGTTSLCRHLCFRYSPAPDASVIDFRSAMRSHTDAVAIPLWSISITAQREEYEKHQRAESLPATHHHMHNRARRQPHRLRTGNS